MNKPIRCMAFVLVLGVLLGALAGPAYASLESIADIMEETETENRGRVSITIGEQRDLSDSLRWRKRDEDDKDRVEWQLYAVRWTSSNEDVLTVDAQGVVTAHRVGTAKVTATGTDNTGQRRVQTITVGVRLAPTATAAITAPHSLNLYEGQRIGLGALLDADGSRGITWTSSNDSIVEVDAQGLVTGSSIGRATLRASWTDATGVVQEEKVSIRVTSALLEYATREMSITLYAGDTLDVTDFYYPVSGKPRSIVYTTSDSAVASLDGGTLTAKAAGSCTLTVRKQDGLEWDSVQRITVQVKG